MNSVLVIAHNSPSLTLKALDSIVAQDVPIDPLFVVANAPRDGLGPALTTFQTHHDEVRIATFPQMRSVSYCWNRGLEWLFHHGAEHVLVVNNDVRLRPDTYRSLRDDGGGFVTAVGVNRESQIEGEWTVAKRPHPDFSAYMIRQEVYEKVGPFDERFLGGYAEDWDYHVRMHRLKVEAYTIGIPFYHYAAGTLKHAHPEEAQGIREQADRNREYFKAKWGVEGGSPDYYALFS